MRKFLASLLSCVLFVSTALADAGQGSLWQQRRQATARSSSQQYAALPATLAPGNPANLLKQFPELKRTASRVEPRSVEGSKTVPAGFQKLLERVPASAGEVRDLFVSPDDKNIALLIQDVHLNREAQQNIAALLGSFGPDPLTVGVEGASGKADLSPMREIHEVDILKSVADTYLHAGKISASSYAGIIDTKGSLSLVGIDHPEHYRANVDAYRQAQRLKPDALKRIEESERRLTAEKAELFHGELATFDALRSQYEKGALGIGPYVERLVAFRSRLPAWSWKNEEIDRFVEAYRMESSLDFKKVEAERGAVLEKLVHASSDAELKELLGESMAYRAGALSYADFYRYFSRALTTRKISLSAHPTFHRYLDYVMLSDRLNAERLLGAVTEMEASLAAQLAATPEQKSLLDRSEALYLERRLIEFTLTPNEWRRYQQARNPELEEFEKFYSEADIRSDYMVDQVVDMLRAAAPTTDGIRRTVVVAGGFHTPMLTETLRRRHISYAVIQPRVTKLAGNGSEYLSIFVREKTPLEKIFEGQKLFLAPAQLNAGFPAGSAVTNEMNAAGRALERPGQVVDSRTPGVVATTLPTVAGATAVGDEPIEGRSRIYFFQRGLRAVGRVVGAVGVAAGIGRVQPADTLLGRIEGNDREASRYSRSIGVDDPALLALPGEPQATGLRTNSRLIAALRAARPAYPVGVPLHLDSHQDLVTNLLAEAAGTPWYDRLAEAFRGGAAFTPEMGVVARTFVESHDLGYSIDFNSPTFEADYKERLVSVWRTIATANGSDPATADRLANETYNLVVAASKEKSLKAYMVPKVLAHGTTSIAIVTQRLEAAGFTPNEALGLALLFAAHHPGYPITMVEQFVVPGSVPLELLPVLLINDVRASANGGLERGNADDLRVRIADYAAGLLGISTAEARRIATLGYSLDRITPARRMQQLDLTKVETNEDGSVKSASQDFWTGGETSKKYPLIVTNIKKFSALSIFEVYRLAIGNLQQEADAAIKAADRGIEGLSAEDAGPLQSLKAIVQEKSKAEIDATKDIQDRAVAWVNRALPGFTGRLENIDGEIAQVRGLYEGMAADAADREAAGYLLGTMIAIKTNGMAMGHMAALQKDARFEADVATIEAQVSQSQLNRPRVTSAGATTVRDRIAADRRRLSDPAIDNFRRLRVELEAVLQQAAEESLNSTAAVGRTGAREENIRAAIRSLVSDFDQVAWVFPNDIARQRQAAVVMAISFQYLLLQDEADLELPHSLRHSADTRTGVFDFIQFWRSQNGDGALDKTYGPPSSLVYLLAAWLHDVGYGSLPLAQAAVNAKAGEDGIQNFKTAPDYHMALGAALVNAPLTEGGQSLMDLIDQLFDLSARPGLAPGSKTGRDDFITMIQTHGADNPDIKQDGLAGTGRVAVRPASDVSAPLTFAVRLADNLDARADDRLESYQKNPIFWGFLMKLAAGNVPADQVTIQFIRNKQAYIQASMLFYQTTQNLQNGEALARAVRDFDTTLVKLGTFDYSNYARLAGVVKSYRLEMVDGQLTVVLTLNYEDKTLSREYKQFQVARMARSFASLSFNGKPVAVEEDPAERSGETTGALAEQRRQVLDLPAYRDLLTAFGAQVGKENTDNNQSALLLSLLDYFDRYGNVDLTVEDRPVGDLLIRRGATDKDVFILVGGELTVERDGTPITVTPGDFVGEMAMANPRGVRNADVRVTGQGPARLIRINEQTFRGFLSDPLFLSNYADFLASRRPVVDETAAAEQLRIAEEAAQQRPPELSALDVQDPSAAINLAQSLAGSLDTPAPVAARSSIIDRIVARVANRNDQAEAQHVLIQSFLAYNHDHPSENIFGSENLVTLNHAGDELIRKDDVSEDAFVVVSGALTVTNGVVVTLDAGALVGEMAISNGGRRTATVTATTPGTEVLRIPGGVLRGMMRDQRVFNAYQKLVRARVEQTRAAVAAQSDEFRGTLTADFTLAIGSFLFGWLQSLGVSARFVDNLTRLSVALLIEAPLFVISLFSPRFLRWFVDRHFRNGVGDTAENRRQIRNGILLVGGLTVAGLAIGAAVAAAFGLPSSQLVLTALATAAILNAAPHFGVNLREILRRRADDRRQAAVRALADDVARALQPFASDQAVSREALERLVRLLTPRADSLGLANAANAYAITSLLSRIHPDDGMTRRDLAAIVAPVLLLMTTRESVIDLAGPEAQAARERLAAPQAVVRLTAAATADQIRAQIAAAELTRKPNDVLVLIVDANTPDDVLTRAEFAGVRFVRNNPSLQLTEASLRDVTGLGTRMGGASLAIARDVVMSDDLLQKIQALKQTMGDRLALYLLLDEATRAVPVAVEQLSELVRVQRLVAIQA